MEIEEYFNYRNDLLSDSMDETGFVDQRRVLSEVLPFMLDAKLIDSEDYNDVYFINDSDNIKINAYNINDTGERLQIFIVNEETIDEKTPLDDLCISQKDHYESQFKRASRFLSKSVNGQLDEQIQDADPAKVLAAKLCSVDGAEQFDVIEIFLISLTASVSFKGPMPQPRRINLPDDFLKFSYASNGTKKTKEFLLLRRVIDLNFLFNVLVSRGEREALTVNFDKSFGYDIEVIKAADEDKFESYLCVLNADVLFDLYKRYSSRLLEKNVRSFLQFNAVNKDIKATIRNEPEKFIAYNNGLTITATGADVSQHKKKLYIRSLTDFQIVNGGQTTASIYFTKKEGIDISKVKVMAKINVAKNVENTELEKLISKISQFSNNQTRVSPVDLRARNQQLISLKKLSESVITPSGSKWFFERAKGEFRTKLRIAGSNSKRLKNEYPNERRFSKEELAKYYSTWGDIPYLVKKGGEKIFRYFIEQISSQEGEKGSPEIDRTFYENLIAKIILFRRLEKIYGQGRNSMGQLRSAVVPYAIAVVFLFTDGSAEGRNFQLSKIWKQEDLEDDLAEYFRMLMILVNDLIKKYSSSEDYGEYSKKQELWDRIKKSNEVKAFIQSDLSIKIFNKYTA